MTEIRRVDVYAVRYTHAGGAFTMSGGRVAAGQDATVVRVETTDGLVGWGEQCVFNAAFLPGYGPTTRAAIEHLARAILGTDARAIDVVHARMDAALRGYAYAKAALDIACWDILGKHCGMRIADLLGGVRQEELELYAGVGIASLDESVARCRELLADGYRHAQVKVGTSPREDVERIEACAEALAGVERLIVDANGHWPLGDAVRVVAAIDDLDLYLEQPCASVAECAEVRRRSRRPMILDEVMTGAREVAEAYAAGALDAVRLKLGNVGGIAHARRARDVAVALGLPLTIEDSGGGDIVTAAAMHVACSTEPRFLLAGYLPSTMVTETIAQGAVRAVDGRAKLPEGAGLGLDVSEAAIGTPARRIE